MPVPLISACMIVKNEAQSLDRCLRSIRPYVDEIIVVDTGSSDGSEEIAERYTDQVYIHPWEGSFAKARNHSLSYAVGEWILIIDADEELQEGDGPCLKETLPRIESEVDHLFFTTRNLKADGGTMSECTNIRLFRNGRGIRYKGIVHNQAVPKGEGRFFPVTLRHYGYALSPEKMEAKFRRTLSLILKQIEEEPDNPHDYHNLCLSLVNHGHYGEALEAGSKAMELIKIGFDKPYPPIYYNLAFLLGKAALASGNYPLAVRVSKEALEENPHHIDSLWNLTMASYRNGEYGEAVLYGERYQEALAEYCKKPAVAIPVNTVGEIGPLLATTGYAASHAGQTEKVFAFFQGAMDDAKWSPDFGIKILHFCKEQNLLETGSQIYSRLAAGHKTDTRLLPFSGIFSSASGTNRHEEDRSLIQEFQQDPILLSSLQEMETQGRLSLKEIRNFIENDKKAPDQKRLLLLVLEAIQREAEGDPVW